MSWMKELRAAGYDPADVEDAIDVAEFTIPDNERFFKGCVIGDPCKCSAAKALRQQQYAEFVWVGAHIAILAYPDGVIERFQHRGVVPKMQDRLVMPPPGTYRLTPPRPSIRLGAAARSRHPVPSGAKRPGAGRRLSLSSAGNLRR